MRPTRREFLGGAAGVLAAGLLPGQDRAPLREFAYRDVTVTSAPHRAQLENTQAVLADISDDALLKPFRAMSGLPAPGPDLGGWYGYRPDYNFRKDDAGLAPSATFGQWLSALARHGAASGDPAIKARVRRLVAFYAETVTPRYYEVNRFPGYCLDKLTRGLVDACELTGDREALRALSRTCDAALAVLPAHAVDRDVAWRPGKDQSWNWDEMYTLPENLFLASRVAGPRYRELASRFLLESYSDPLARGENVLGGRQAYSYVNALCSAMQAYFVLGSEKHLRAARNGFFFLEQQSWATGGWGADELLRHSASHGLYESLSKSHNSFETACGSFAHAKLTRYLLRATREGRYGDSMERVFWNGALGALPLQPDGRAFYYSDYSSNGRKVYSDHRWPCCSGTLPQVAADYGINTYLHDEDGLWVNLYMPSRVRFGGVELEQTGEYPLGDSVRFRVVSGSGRFAVHLRVPGWVESASLTVNDRPEFLRVVRGFTPVRRRWTAGDRIELRLSAPLRLEGLDPAHPEVAALLWGPLVLFALHPGPVNARRADALAARRVSSQKWEMAGSEGPITLVPWTAVGDRTYSTYLRTG